MVGLLVLLIHLAGVVAMYWALFSDRVYAAALFYGLWISLAVATSAYWKRLHRFEGDRKETVYNGGFGVLIGSELVVFLLAFLGDKFSWLLLVVYLSGYALNPFFLPKFGRPWLMEKTNRGE